MEEILNIPKGLKVKGKAVTGYSGDEKELIIPEGIERINSYALNDCISLQRVILPSTVKAIGSLAFGGCINLQEVHFNFTEKIDIGWSIFFKCPGIIKLVFAGDSKTLEANLGARYDPPEFEMMYGEICVGKWHYPMGHQLAEEFFCDSYCQADGVSIKLQGRRVHFLGWE
ncbi:MAG: leucine-rich repeat protein [Clostridia bacterium]|nr:leucine-rich repeat protein [Clostridia bacterium]